MSEDPSVAVCLLVLRGRVSFDRSSHVRLSYVFLRER
jgi:hypothetical protein